MIKKDLTAYKRGRFAKANKCPICGNLIFDNEQFEMEVFKMGHSRCYKFYHEGCYYGEEKAKAAGPFKTAMARKCEAKNITARDFD